MKLARISSLALVLSALAGCGSIGEGSTVESIELQIASTGSTTGPFVVSQCLRDQLVAIATFSDGTRADFSFRTAWTSSDPNVVQVSDGDVATVTLQDGAFVDSTTSHYRPGTVIPRGTAGGQATITASFLGLSSSMVVQISAPTFRVAPVNRGVDPIAYDGAQPRYLGPGTTQRFGFLAERADGQTQTAGTLNILGNINPILWRFVDGRAEPADTSVVGDFDKWVVPASGDVHATVDVAGVVTAKATGLTPAYEVQAVTSLCADDSNPAFDAFKPTATVQVAPFASDQPLELQYEQDFNGPGVENGDLIAGTIQTLEAFGRLDLDNDGIGDVTQDLSNQVDLKITHTTACTSGTTNCTCDTGDTTGATCTKRLLIGSGTSIQTVITDDSAGATVQACFNGVEVDTLHADDCEEAAADPVEGTPRLSNTLPVQVIAVDLTGATGSVALSADATSEPAFTYPGAQFQAFGTFKALSGMPFTGGSSDTGVQKLTNFGVWLTRPQGSTTSFSSVAFVRSTNDQFWGPVGSVAYAEDVTEATPLDVYFEPGNLFSSIPDSTPLTFTVCPSTSTSC